MALSVYSQHEDFFFFNCIQRNELRTAICFCFSILSRKNERGIYLLQLKPSSFNHISCPNQKEQVSCDKWPQPNEMSHASMLVLQTIFVLHHTHTHARTHARTHVRAHSRTHKNTHTYTLSHTHTHTLYHTQNGNKNKKLSFKIKLYI